MRLFPRSLEGILISVLVLVVSVSQVSGILLAMSSIDLTVFSLMHSPVVLQSISLRNMMLPLPPAERMALAERASLEDLCLTVTPAAAAPVPSQPSDSIFVERLQTMLAGQLSEPPRIMIVPVAANRAADAMRSPFPECWRYAGRLAPPHAQTRPRRHHFVGLTISLPLDDGTWINILATVITPPPWSGRTMVPWVLLIVSVSLTTALTVRLSLRPLKRLAQAARQLGRGENVRQIRESGPSEVVAVIAAFNQMQHRLTRFVEDRTRLLAAISHDLRTPLTTLRLKASLMEDAAADQITGTIDDMEAIVEAGLNLARSTNGEESRVVDMVSLAQSVVDDLSDLGMAVMMTEGEPVRGTCRPLAIRRALRNLVENAVRYGRHADVSVVRMPEWLCLRVEDDGPGIPRDRLDDVLKPFVRLEESRNSETGGIGLGLAIAKTIAHAHGGDIVLVNRAQGGLRADLRLPCSGGDGCPDPGADVKAPGPAGIRPPGR